MGLAASQARLLTITSRKSDAQYESMRLSHQKSMLTRSLKDLSNDYQNSLNKTKLYYDFYGNGSTDNILSYNLFMTPSFINDYTPVLVTNQQNRIVLSSNFASAARIAGIPEEGLDGYIDTETRNRFIEVLANLGEIDEPTAEVIKKIQYNPNFGLGNALGVYTTEETESYSSFLASLSNIVLSDYAGLNVADLNDGQGTHCHVMAYQVDYKSLSGNTPSSESYVSGVKQLNDINVIGLDSHFIYQNKFSDSGSNWNDLTLDDILYGDNDIVLFYNTAIDYYPDEPQYDNDPLNVHQYDRILDIVQGVINVLADAIEERYALDDDVQLALKSAFADMNSFCWSNTEPQVLGVYTNGLADAGDSGQSGDEWSGGSEWHDYVINGNGTGNYHLNYDNISSGNANMDTFINPEYVSDHGGSTQELHFMTAEDCYNSNGTANIGYEPASYWYSLPNLSLDKTDGTGRYYVAGWDDVQGIHLNSTLYALYTARNNLVLTNMYTCTPSDHCGYIGDQGAISLSSFVKAWYTYFIHSYAELKMDGASNDEQIYLQGVLDNTDVKFHEKNTNSKFATDYNLSDLNFVAGEVAIEDGTADIATFYDTIINQICEYGWTENNKVKEDTSYLQDMLQTGKMFLFKLANDNYYYQESYSTDTFIKEIADETAIAEAEAKYKTQKARINAKEEALDMRMRNLDTEISALESEYDAVKKIISTKLQNSFQRYQA